MLSVFLTEQLERHAERTENTDMIFIFCSAEDENCSTATAVLRRLVHQILDKRPQLVKHVLPHFESSDKTRQTLSSLETLWLIFKRLVVDEELGTMFCVFDGLDECGESTLRGLLPRVINLLSGDDLSSQKSIFKLAIISRDLTIPGLQRCARVRLDPDNDEKVAGDIELFVSARVAELSMVPGFNNDFREFVQKALLERAEGTFLWVGFAMHELLKKETCTEIEEALAELPSGLPAIYSRMLLQIPAKKRKLSRKILRWVTFAICPLGLRELAAAVGVRAASPHITAKQARRDAVALCGPLLKIQKQKVSLVHQSARDYLLRKERDEDPVLEAFRFQEESTHLTLAQKCLRCIARSDLQRRSFERDELNNLKGSLLLYAIRYWHQHAKSCSALATTLFDPFEFFLPEKSSLRSNWWKSYEFTISSTLYPWVSPLLHIACHSAIMPWVEAVLAHESSRPVYKQLVNKRDRDGDTALHWVAAQEGSDEIVRLLIGRGADVEAKDDYGLTPLHYAVREGNEAAVRLLINRGADVNANDDEGMTVLHYAADNIYEALVKLLIDRGANIEARDDGGRTSLYLAAFPRDKTTAQLLIAAGADLDAKANDGSTPRKILEEDDYWE